MFELNHNDHLNGFSIEFSNKYRISVQFGRYNYCKNNQGALILPSPLKRKDFNVIPKAIDSKNAEVAIIQPDGNFIPWKDVQGWIEPDTVALLTMYISTLRIDDKVDMIDLNKIRLELPDQIKPILEEQVLINV